MRLPNDERKKSNAHTFVVALIQSRVVEKRSREKMHPKKFISFSLIYLYMLLARCQSLIFVSLLRSLFLSLCLNFSAPFGLCARSNTWTIQTMHPNDIRFRFIRFCFAVQFYCAASNRVCVCHVRRRMLRHTLAPSQTHAWKMDQREKKNFFLKSYLLILVSFSHLYYPTYDEW